MQKTDYNIVVRLIILLGSQLPNSYFPAPPLTLSASSFTLSDFSTDHWLS